MKELAGIDAATRGKKINPPIKQHSSVLLPLRLRVMRTTGAKPTREAVKEYLAHSQENWLHRSKAQKKVREATAQKQGFHYTARQVKVAIANVVQRLDKANHELRRGRNISRGRNVSNAAELVSRSVDDLQQFLSGKAPRNTKDKIFDLWKTLRTISTSAGKYGGEKIPKDQLAFILNQIKKARRQASLLSRVVAGWRSVEVKAQKQGFHFDADDTKRVAEEVVEIIDVANQRFRKGDYRGAASVLKVAIRSLHPLLSARGPSRIRKVIHSLWMGIGLLRGPLKDAGFQGLSKKDKVWFAQSIRKKRQEALAFQRMVSGWRSVEVKAQKGLGSDLQHDLKVVMKWIDEANTRMRKKDKTAGRKLIAARQVLKAYMRHSWDGQPIPGRLSASLRFASGDLNNVLSAFGTYWRPGRSEAQRRDTLRLALADLKKARAKIATIQTKYRGLRSAPIVTASAKTDAAMKRRYIPDPTTKKMRRTWGEIGRESLSHLKGNFEKANREFRKGNPKLAKTYLLMAKGTSESLKQKLPVSDGGRYSKKFRTLAGVVKHQATQASIAITDYMSFRPTGGRDRLAKPAAREAVKEIQKGLKTVEMMSRLLSGFRSAPPTKRIRLDLPRSYPVNMKRPWVFQYDPVSSRGAKVTFRGGFAWAVNQAKKLAQRDHNYDARIRLLVR